MIPSTLIRLGQIPLVLGIAAALIPVLSAAAADGPDSRPAGPPALIIVDVQNFYFPGGRLALAGSEAARLKARTILDFFRAEKWPVIHVRHLGKAAADAPLTGDSEWSFRADLAPAPGEPVVTKREINAFRGTNLLDVLNGLKVKDLVIIGMQTHMCLEGAVRAAADLGFSVTVAGDACATRDLEFNGTVIPAEAVHLSTLATLKGNYARIVTTEELIKGLK
jgi:nicotinamidase-related amidase